MGTAYVQHTHRVLADSDGCNLYQYFLFRDSPVDILLISLPIASPSSGLCAHTHLVLGIALDSSQESDELHLLGAQRHQPVLSYGYILRGRVSETIQCRLRQLENMDAIMDACRDSVRGSWGLMGSGRGRGHTCVWGRALVSEVSSSSPLTTIANWLITTVPSPLRLKTWVSEAREIMSSGRPSQTVIKGKFSSSEQKWAYFAVNKSPLP